MSYMSVIPPNLNFKNQLYVHGYNLNIQVFCRDRLKISQHPNNYIPMTGLWCSQELTHHSDNACNIWSSQCKVIQFTYESPISLGFLATLDLVVAWSLDPSENSLVYILPNQQLLHEHDNVDTDTTYGHVANS